MGTVHHQMSMAASAALTESWATEAFDRLLFFTAPKLSKAARKWIAAMACCQSIDELLAKAISEHDAVMKRLTQRQPVVK